MLEGTDDEAKIGQYAIQAITVMLAGLALVAVGDELSIANPEGKPSIAASIVLFGGPALCVLAQAVFPKRTKGRAVSSRPIAVIAFVVGGVRSLWLPTLLAATLATAIMVGVAVHDSVIEGRGKSARQEERDVAEESWRRRREAIFHFFDVRTGFDIRTAIVAR